MKIDNFQLRYGISTLPGQSGCPVVANNSIIAIHVGGKEDFNVGRVIDEALIKTVRKWIVELNAAPFNIEEEDTCKHIKPIIAKLKEPLKKHSFSHKKSSVNESFEINTLKQNQKNIAPIKQ